MTEPLIPHLTSELGLTPDEKTALASLEPRLGRAYIVQRLRREAEYETLALRERTYLFNREHWLSNPALIRSGLRLLGLHERARRNALAIEVRRHEVQLPHLPGAFDGFVLLHLADLHFGMNEHFVDTLIRRIEPLRYDLCVLTGDYRALTYGPYRTALEGLERLRAAIKGPAYAVLGNHDTIRMVPAMERMGYRLLLNEATRVARDGEAIYFAGVDDGNFYRMDNIDKAARDIPPGAVSILLSHTPETYHRAADATFDLMLCGHTHGGQICLPGGIPIRTEAASPRRFVRGSWRYGRMIGYTSTGAGTSIVDARLNCPPEVTLHRLRRSPAPLRRSTLQ
ncbi:metallophosphoesterase [Microvirga sp. KLBC 81]|uniref:metallophosphoesterase n=1 Tax=Microvirga sp. KLBC 81 TaxID=1862707 RepID=UPI000D5180CB|nr:metallophosphoesterase [Microvirga sp. KLBC 81]PVE20354.1 metallophosphoesterase [Microvirga sp. KLBC 81]